MRYRFAMLVVGLLVVFAGAGTSTAGASTLDERRFEWIFDANYVDQSGGVTTTNVGFAWGYLIGHGYTEVGVSGSYVKIEDDQFTDPTQSITIAGPFFTWNWMPRAEHATGFINASVGAIAGDVSKAYDYSVEGAIGVKLFVGDSAAVTVQYFVQTFQTTNDFGDTENFRGIAIGIALYSGRKH